MKNPDGFDYQKVWPVEELAAWIDCPAMYRFRYLYKKVSELPSWSVRIANVVDANVRWWLQNPNATILEVVEKATREVEEAVLGVARKQRHLLANPAQEVRNALAAWNGRRDFRGEVSGIGRQLKGTVQVTNVYYSLSATADWEEKDGLVWYWCDPRSRLTEGSGISRSPLWAFRGICAGWTNMSVDRYRLYKGDLVRTKLPPLNDLRGLGTGLRYWNRLALTAMQNITAGNFDIYAHPAAGVCGTCPYYYTGCKARSGGYRREGPLLGRQMPAKRRKLAEGTSPAPDAPQGTETPENGEDG